MNKLCESCKYFVVKDSDGVLGKCKRFPPFLKSLKDYKIQPTVSYADWCGEHTI